MWVCTPFGILMPALRPAETIEPGDDRTLQVRARHREYLDTFRERYCPELGESLHFAEHDYPWKAYVTPEALATAMARMTLSIDYEKFKPEAERGGLPDHLADELHSCYNEMWAVQLRYGDGTSVYDLGWPAELPRCELPGLWPAPARRKRRRAAR
jgi:hypothetical protein